MSGHFLSSKCCKILTQLFSNQASQCDDDIDDDIGDDDDEDDSSIPHCLQTLPVSSPSDHHIPYNHLL